MPYPTFQRHPSRPAVLQAQYTPNLVPCHMPCPTHQTSFLRRTPPNVLLVPPIQPVSVHSFLFKDQFIEVTTSVPADADLYGTGETVLPGGLLLPRGGNVLTMWARDSASAESEINTYGAHPFYLQLNKGERADVLGGRGTGLDSVG